MSILTLDEPGRLMERIEEQPGDSVWVPCDVTVQADVDRAIEQTLEEFGRLLPHPEFPPG